MFGAVPSSRSALCHFALFAPSFCQISFELVCVCECVLVCVGVACLDSIRFHRCIAFSSSVRVIFFHFSAAVYGVVCLQCLLCCRMFDSSPENEKISDEKHNYRTHLHKNAGFEQKGPSSAIALHLRPVLEPLATPFALFQHSNPAARPSYNGRTNEHDGKDTLLPCK